MGDGIWTGERYIPDMGTLGDFAGPGDRKSTRLNSSHITISYAVFCLKKKKKERIITNFSERAEQIGTTQRPWTTLFKQKYVKREGKTSKELDQSTDGDTTDGE